MVCWKVEANFLGAIGRPLCLQLCRCRTDHEDVIVVVHMFPPVTGQPWRQTIELYARFSLQWLLRARRKLHLFEISSDPMFLWITSNSCPMNLLLVRNHEAEIIIVKHFVLRCSNVTRVRIKPRSCDQGCRKNDAFTLSASLSTRIDRR